MKFSSRFKKAAFGLTAIATSLFIGMTAACSQSGDDDDDDENATTKEDVQEIKNGNFEFYDDNDGLYPISTPDNWTFSYNGTSSSSMSGVIKTNKEGWDYLIDPNLPDTLEANDDLDSDDEDKVDYNGVLTDDLLYKNMHDALSDNLVDSDKGDDEKKEYIDNPYTHNLRWDGDAEKYVYVDGEGNQADVYTDDDGKVYSDAELTEEIGTSVLMVHNYRSNYYRGTEGYYTSSTTLTLEANTSCKISLWVKTAELYSDNSKNERTAVTFNKGAYIKVNTTVGGNDLDTFTIKNINTEILNPDGDNNGWVQYTVYVQASSFASTTVNLTLGLGENGSKGINTVEGYAFFDDITYEKYLDLDSLKAAENFDTIRESDENGAPSNTCYPLAADADVVFRVDEPKYQTENGEGGTTDYTEENNSQDRYFFIDFASTEERPLTFNSYTVAAGLTVDGDKYISSKNGGLTVSGVGTLDNGSDSAKLPANLKNNGIAVSDDLLTIADITEENWALSVDGFIYNDLLTNSLKSAVKLPGVNASASTLIMLSAKGAAYESRITDSSFTVADGEYKLLSFWIKTSDFSGKTAATVSVYDPDDEDNVSSFTIDTTTQAGTDFGDDKDIYDGWIRCFIRVSNTSGEDEAKKFVIKVNLGLTSIKGTTVTDYKYGWVALTNLSVMDLDEDVYGYTSSLGNSADLSFTESSETYSDAFDSVQGGTNNQIKTDLATPASYTGANGASVAVKPTGSAANDYDTTNNNAYAGLLNRENLENYKDKDWFNKIYAGSPIDNDAIWEALAGKYSYQPLLIVNAVRDISENVKGVYNYGYIGGTETISSDSYKQVSVKVKVSTGAIAYVYLIDTDSENNDVLTYKLPEYNFYYDDDGNILKDAADDGDTLAEAKAKIAYTLRADGLYENGDGKLYANFYNLTRYYDYKYEHESFYDGDGNAVTFENLVTGNVYYADANRTKYAPHYLIAGGKENNKVYEYVGGLDDEATYYYVEDGVANESKLVYGVDKELAHYVYDQATATPYSFVIDGTLKDENGDYIYADKWITVTFNIHTGSESKNYRLELWSGSRDEQQTSGIEENSYVLFDYSPELETTLSSDTYETKLGYYTDAIRADLIENISGELPDNDREINDLEKLVTEGYENIYNYKALYYTFSLYDSSAFIPFNEETADDDQTGYSYSYSDYSESLALLKVEDLDDADNYSMTAFVDYSVIDKSIDIIGEPTVDTDDDETDTDTTEDTNVWLLAASIAVTVAILIAIIALLVKWLIGKYGKKRAHVGKNTYNFNKNKRYVKKYVKANGDVTESDVDANLLNGDAEVADTENAENGAVEENSQSADTSATTEATEENNAESAPEASDGEQPEETKPDGTDENKPE